MVKSEVERVFDAFLFLLLVDFCEGEVLELWNDRDLAKIFES